MGSDKLRVLSFFARSDSSIQNIKWEALLVVVTAVLIVLIIILICEYSDNLLCCRRSSHLHRTDHNKDE